MLKSERRLEFSPTLKLSMRAELLLPNTSGIKLKRKFRVRLAHKASFRESQNVIDTDKDFTQLDHQRHTVKMPVCHTHLAPGSPESDLSSFNRRSVLKTVISRLKREN